MFKIQFRIYLQLKENYVTPLHMTFKATNNVKTILGLFCIFNGVRTLSVCLISLLNSSCFHVLHLTY